MSAPPGGDTLSAMGDQDRRDDANEGEGSRSADQHYRQGVQRTVQGGHVEADAERARKDVEADPEGFRRAEEEGRSRSAGEAPGDLDR